MVIHYLSWSASELLEDGSFICASSVSKEHLDFMSENSAQVSLGWPEVLGEVASTNAGDWVDTLKGNFTPYSHNLDESENASLIIQVD